MDALSTPLLQMSSKTHDRDVELRALTKGSDSGSDSGVKERQKHVDDDDVTVCVFITHNI